MNCYKALKINSFSGSVNIDSTGEDSISGPGGIIGESRKASGTCNIITPFTDFTNRELKCRALLDYRVANDPVIAANGWLIRRYTPIHNVDGLCSNCGLEGNLKYENDGFVWGTITIQAALMQLNFQQVHGLLIWGRGLINFNFAHAHKLNYLHNVTRPILMYFCRGEVVGIT